MRTNKFLRNVIVMAISLIAVTVFSGCGNNDDPKPDDNIVVESISLDNSTLTIAIGENATLVATTVPVNAKVTWTSSNANAAVDDNGKVTGKAEGTAIITAKAGDKTAECVVTVRGALINGVVWALKNVDDVGAFASTHESTGKFYQWNRKTAWNATGAVSGWDASVPTSTEWENEHDPSPTGWRVPTFTEIQKLLEESKVDRNWTAQNGVNGFKFKDKSNGASIFLPAAGHRLAGDGNLNEAGVTGSYWSNTTVDGFAYGFSFNEIAAQTEEYTQGNYGQSVRPVLK